MLCTCVVLLLFFCVGTLGDTYWVSSILEWTCVFLYMTLTMLIMSALPCYDQITLSFHVKSKIQNNLDNNKNGGETGGAFSSDSTQKTTPNKLASIN